MTLPRWDAMGCMRPERIRQLASDLYRDGPPFVRFLQRNRDRICPLDVLLETVPPASSVLDVGCGAGLFVMLLAATGRASSAVGVDTNEKALAAARQAARRLGTAAGAAPGAFAFRTVRSSAGWPGGPFDVVSLIDVMHHVPPEERRAFLSAASRRVRPGGLLVYKDVCSAPAWRAWANRLHDLVLARQWVHEAPLADIEAWAAATGLVVRQRRRYARLIYGHELVVFRKPADKKT